MLTTNQYDAPTTHAIVDRVENLLAGVELGSPDPWIAGLMEGQKLAYTVVITILNRTLDELTNSTSPVTA